MTEISKSFSSHLTTILYTYNHLFFGGQIVTEAQYMQCERALEKISHKRLYAETLSKEESDKLDARVKVGLNVQLYNEDLVTSTTLTVPSVAHACFCQKECNLMEQKEMTPNWHSTYSDKTQVQVTTLSTRRFETFSAEYSFNDHVIMLGLVYCARTN